MSWGFTNSNVTYILSISCRFSVRYPNNQSRPYFNGRRSVIQNRPSQSFEGFCLCAHLSTFYALLKIEVSWPTPRRLYTHYFVYFGHPLTSNSAPLCAILLFRQISIRQIQERNSSRCPVRFSSLFPNFYRRWQLYRLFISFHLLLLL